MKEVRNREMGRMDLLEGDSKTLSILGLDDNPDSLGEKVVFSGVAIGILGDEGYGLTFIAGWIGASIGR